MLIIWMSLSLDSIENKLFNIAIIGIYIYLLIYVSQIVAVIFTKLINSNLKNDFISGFSIGIPMLFSLIIITSMIGSISIILSFQVLMVLFAIIILFVKYEYKPFKIDDLIGLILIGCSITLILIPRLNSLLIDEGSYVYRLWGDEFVLSTLMSNMAYSASLNEVKSNIAYGVPMGIYHYGAYILGASIRSFSDIAPLDSMKAITAPFWLLYFGCTLVFSARILGFTQLKPYLIAAIIIVIPDAYQIGFGNNYLGWHFNLLISPSMISGVSISLLSLVFLSEYLNYRKNTDLIISFVLNFLIIFFKVHLIVFVWPIFFSLVLWTLIGNKYTNTKKIIISCTFITFCYFLISIISKTSLTFPLIDFKYDGYKYFYRILMLTQEKNFISNTLDPFILNGGAFLSFISFNIYILLFGFGYTLLSLFIPLDNLNNSKFYLKRIILSMLILYVGVSSFFILDSRGVGTPDELLHRPFILVFTLLAFLLIIEVFSMLNNLSEKIKFFFTTLLLIISYYFGFVGSASGATFLLDMSQKFKVEQCALNAMQWINQHKGKIKGIAQGDSYLLTHTLSGVTGLTPYYTPRNSLNIFYPDLVRNREKHLFKINNDLKKYDFMNDLNLEPIDLYMRKMDDIPPQNSINFFSKSFKCNASESYVVIYKKNLFIN
jgi:hypothetical protein